MWCKHCRQDTPGISSVAGAPLGCARCGAAFVDDDAIAPRAPTAPLADANRTSASTTPSYPTFEDWEIDQSFRELQARVGPWKRVDRPLEVPREVRESTARRTPQWRVDAAHTRPKGPHRRKSRQPGRFSLAAWAALSLGLMAFACGAVLLGWSYVQHRPELWNLGMPIVIVGQVGLLLGLILQLERIWQSSRYAARKLERVDSQLHQLEQTAHLLGVTHSSAAQAFYAHLSEDANPQILLADLKGQIDLLAQSMAKRSA